MGAFPGSFPKGQFGKQPPKDPRIALAEEKARRERAERERQEIKRLQLQKEKEAELFRAKEEKIKKQAIQERAKKIEIEKARKKAISNRNALNTLIARSNLNLRRMGEQSRTTQLIRQGGNVYTVKNGSFEVRGKTLKEKVSKGEKIRAKDIIPRGGFKNKEQRDKAVRQLTFIDRKKQITKAQKEKLIKAIEDGSSQRSLLQREIQKTNNKLQKNLPEKVADFITKADIRKAQRDEKNYDKVISGAKARSELIDIIVENRKRSKLVPEKINKLRKLVNKIELESINKLITAGHKEFIGALGYGESLAQTGAKLSFLALATPTGRSTTKALFKASRGNYKGFYDDLKKISKSKEGKKFTKELVSDTQIKALKETYTDPKTYAAAAVGAAFITATKLGNRKTVETKTPKSGSAKAKSLKNSVVVDSKTGRISIVNSKGKVIRVPKRLEAKFKKAMKKGEVKRSKAAKKRADIKRIQKEIDFINKLKQKTRSPQELKKIAIKRAKLESQLKNVESGRVLTAQELKNIATKRAKAKTLKRSKAAKKGAKTRSKNKLKKPKSESQRINEFFDKQEAKIRNILRREAAAKKRTQAKRIKDAKKAGFDSIEELEKFQKGTQKQKAKITREVLKRELERRLSTGQRLTEARQAARDRAIQDTLRDLKIGKIKIKKGGKKTVRKQQQISRERINRIKKRIDTLRKKENAQKTSGAGKQQLVLKKKAKTKTKAKASQKTIKISRSKLLGAASSGLITEVKRNKNINIEAFTASGRKLNLNNITKSRSDIKPILVITTTPDIKSSNIMDLLQNIKPEQEPKTKIKQEIEALQDQVKDIKISQKQEQKQKQKQEQKQKQKQKEKTKTKTKTKKKTKKITKAKPKTKRKTKKKKKRSQSGYVGQVRARGKKTGKRKYKRGKFITVTRKTTKNRAIRSAARLADNTVSRSIRVIRKGTIKKRKDIKRPSILTTFRKAKRNKKILVEKSKYAINTRGEKKGITLKGALAKRRRSIKPKIKAKLRKKSKKTYKTTTKSRKRYKRAKKGVKSKTRKKRRSNGIFDIY